MGPVLLGTDVHMKESLLSLISALSEWTVLDEAKQGGLDSNPTTMNTFDPPFCITNQPMIPGKTIPHV